MTGLVHIFHLKVALRTPHHFEKKLKIHQMQQKNYKCKFEGVNWCYSLLPNRAVQTNSGVMMHQNFRYCFFHQIKDQDSSLPRLKTISIT